MADLVSQIKGLDNVTYDLQDKVSTFGGRNYLLGTKDGSGGDKSDNVILNGEVATWPDPTFQTGTFVSQAKIPQDQFFGYNGTLSFEYRSDDGSDLTRQCLNIPLHGSATENGERTRFVDILSPTVNPELFPTPTSTGQKATITVENIQLSDFDSGSGDVNYCGVQFFNYTLNPIDIRHIKLERGTKATDGSPAPEDIVKFIGNETIEFFQ